MNRIAFISALTVLLMSACSKPEPAPSMEQFDKYIFFSQNVHTKASLIESTADMNGKQFGVVGFKYDDAHSWESIKTSATPDVFTTNPQAVTCDANGYGSYSPLQGWSNSKKYTFFAFYPYANQSVSLVNLDGTSYTGGVPAIKYTMDEVSLASSMVDVMIATPQTDKYWISSTDNNLDNGDVAFQFSHCLSSLGLNAKNSSAGDITIKNITLVVDGIKYNSAIIPLNDSAEQYAGPETTIREVFSLQLTESEKSVAATGKEIADKLMFIPQTDNVSISLTIDYQRKYGDNDPTDDSFSTTTPLTTILTKGKKHIVHVNFNDSNTYVMIKSGNWDDGPNMNHEFN